VIEKFDLDGLELLVEDALDDMLNAARLATIASWIERATARQCRVPILAIAQAEVDLRLGLHMKAQAEATRAAASAENSRCSRFRALETAARAAHAGSREGEALGLYREASEGATNERSERRAQWGQMMCAAALELDEAHELLQQLELTACRSDTVELVRMAGKQLSLGFRFGFVRHLSSARDVAELVPAVNDPFARCSFRSSYSWALVLGGYYEEALTQAAALLEDASKFRVDVALSHGHAMLGYSLAGLRQYDSALTHLGSAADLARRFNDGFAIQNEYALRVRVLLQQGRAAEACAIEPPDISHAVKGMAGEVLASRGLALACLGRLDDALSLGRQAVARTQGIEVRVLWPAIQAVVALKSRDSQVVDRARELVDVAFDAGGVDILINAYRSSHDLLAVLLNSDITRERAVFAVGRAGDGTIAEENGLAGAARLDPRESLSPREREVYLLVCVGLSNRDIASRLFISEATVKAHVHHVFDKLGIRSRTALALNAAHDRLRQAAPNAASDSQPGSGG
jgi:DNA-binding CsgD family transcriptional regulator/tetratricopeptide (TPR) repeat protein